VYNIDSKEKWFITSAKK